MPYDDNYYIRNKFVKSEHLKLTKVSQSYEIVANDWNGEDLFIAFLLETKIIFRRHSLFQTNENLSTPSK